MTNPRKAENKPKEYYLAGTSGAVVKLTDE